MDESDEHSKGRQRSPYLPPPPKSNEDSPEVRVPRASPLPSSLSGHVRRTDRARPSQQQQPEERAKSPLGRVMIALIVFAVLAAAVYLALASNA